LNSPLSIWDMGYLHFLRLPLDVNRLQNVVSGCSCGEPDGSCLTKGSAYSLVLSHALSLEVALFPLLFYRQWNSPVGKVLTFYDKNTLKIDSKLSLTSFFNL
jgi:hypothetical protein